MIHKVSHTSQLSRIRYINFRYLKEKYLTSEFLTQLTDINKSF